MVMERLRRIVSQFRSRLAVRPAEAISPKDAEYAQRLRTEIERYRTVENVHDLPEIFHVWSDKYIRPKMEAVLGVSGIEQFYAKYILQYAAENPSEDVRIA